MNITNLGKLIDPTEFQIYVDESEKLETVVHKYGKDFVIPDYPCWMEYKNEANILGSISFSRHTSKNPILKEMVQKMYGIFKTIFHPDRTVLLERIHFIRTKGNITVHKDEAGRNTCINIGVRNSSGSITKMSNDNVYDNFYNNHSTITVMEGYAYLMNTNQYHAVESLNDSPRYLITYGFSDNFDILEKEFRKQ
jgi:GH15 family glucan-1,4-alpha-glucosidase